MTIFNNNVDLTVSSGCFRGSATAEDILPLIQIKSKLGRKWQLNSSLSISPPTSVEQNSTDFQSTAI